MSHLSELIEELCPNGVETFEKIGDFLEYEQPTKYLVKDTNYSDEYETPVLTAGQTFILGYTNETEGIYPASKYNPVIIFDDFTTAFQWVDFPFKAKSSAMKILKAREGANCEIRYLYHLMQTIKFTPEGHKRHWIGTYSQIEIPLPPLPVQREIVKILDNFTELTAELTAELELRKKQYAYYRDKLLSFEGEDVRWVTLGEVCKKVCSGGTPTSTVSEYYGGDIPWLRTQEVDFKNIQNTSMFITKEGLENSSAKWIPENCVIVAMYGATVGKVAINKIPVTTNQACCNLEIDESLANYRFVFHFLSSKYEYIKSLGKGSQTNINAQIVKGIQIPLPPLDEQQRIVDILDKFDALVNDLNDGIPAEIEGRKKQYEYYREKLLTFKRIDNS